MNDGELEATISSCELAHRRLRVTLGALDDEIARRPSRLPDWTVAHVLTHIARNADSHVRILEGALTGEHLDQYAGGAEQRARDIEAGAGRSSGELVDDVITSFVNLEDTWAKMTPEAWDGHGYGLSGGDTANLLPCRRLPFTRWREVEMHHVDAGLGYEVTDWPAEYVEAELANTLSTLTERIADPDQRARLLAWLVGRADQPGEIDLEAWRPGWRPGWQPTPTST